MNTKNCDKEYDSILGQVLNAADIEGQLRKWAQEEAQGEADLKEQIEGVPGVEVKIPR